MMALWLTFIIVLCANFVYCDPNPVPEPQLFFNPFGALFGLATRKPVQQYNSYETLKLDSCEY